VLAVFETPLLVLAERQTESRGDFFSEATAFA
jgi:hypothetical protein